MEIDGQMMLDQVMMLGLVSREQLHEATAAAEDGSPDAVLRMLLRKGALTSWQVDRLKKGDPTGFFFGDSKVLFHLAEGTFARVYRGEHSTTKAALAIKVLRQRFALIPRSRRPFSQGGRGRHEAAPSQYRASDRRRPAGEPALHDHGIRRGNQSPRFHEAAHACSSGTGGAAHDGHGAGPQVLTRARRHPPRYQGNQYPDLQRGRGQARRFRPGHHPGGREQAGRQEPADRRLFGARAHVQQPQGRSPVRHLLPGLRVLPDADRPATHGGVGEQGHAPEDAQAVVRGDQADRRAPLCPRRGDLPHHREA